MHNKNLRMLIVAGLVWSVGLSTDSARAQTAPANSVPANGGVLALPKGVTKVVSIDAHNILLVESVDADGKRHYNVIEPRHVYSGGLARIFGGTIIPTAVLATPRGADGSDAQGSTGFAPIRGNGPFQQMAPFAGAAPPPGGVIGNIFGGRQ